MATNQMILEPAKENISENNKALGVVALIGAPMLLVETIFRVYAPETVESNVRTFAFLELLYILGWICATIGIRQLRVTGNGKGAKVLFTIQITGLILAAFFNVQDIFQIKPEQSGIFYIITDAAYPFSHLLMNIVGIFIVRANVWSGFQKLAPFLIGLALPSFFAFAAIVGFEKAMFLFPAMTATGFLIIGFSLFQNRAFR